MGAAFALTVLFLKPTEAECKTMVLFTVFPYRRRVKK